MAWESVAGSEQRRGGTRPFRYEIMWERHDEFEHALKDIWTRPGKANTLLELQRKIEDVTGSL
jgi:hypothetical protein